VAQVSKITPTGTLYTAGAFDEVTYNPASGVKKNLFPTSANLSSGFWSFSNGTITGNTTTAPDGTSTATTLAGTSAATPFFGSVISAVPGTTYTFSIYAKAGTQSRVMMLLYGVNFNAGGSNQSVTFDLSLGTVITTAASPQGYGIQDIGSGWYRIYITGTATRIASDNAQIIRFQDGIYVSGNYAYVWGPQSEIGSVPTIYEPTGLNAVPAPTFAARTDSVGNNYITNMYDEVTYNPASGVKKNLLSGSNTFTSTYWSIQSAPTLTPNSYTAPDGTNTAWLYNITAPTGRGVIQTVSAIVVKQTYTFSIWVNAIQNTSVYFVININGVTTFSSTQAITVAQGWQRLYYTFTPITTAGGVQVQFQDVSGNTGNMFYVWGAQVELGSAPTIYEPTGANAVPVPTFAQRTEIGGNVYVSGNYDEITWSSPSITTGLVVNLDPAQAISYSGGTTLTDLSGSNNSLTLVNNPTSNTSGFGSLTFDGATNYGSKATTSNIPSGSNAFTLSTWFYPTSSATAMRIVAYGAEANGQTVSVRLNAGAAYGLSFGHWGGPGYDWGPGRVATANTWINVVEVYNGVTDYMYINGVLAGTYIPNTLTIPANSALYIGKRATGEFFAGSVGQVLLYNRALTAAEVQQNFTTYRTRYGI
jgi:Concanavalin A-like lectin/glucanases superfamily